MTLFEGLLLQKGRCFLADVGKAVPMMRSISPNVIGISLNPTDFRCSSSGWYFEGCRM